MPKKTISVTCCYTKMAESKISVCSKLMAAQGLTIAFAESATAGGLCSEFALTEESGQVLKGGIACYDADLKVQLLKVPQELIDEFCSSQKPPARKQNARIAAKPRGRSLLNN
jgi:nicotinamide-nucleotide amidase